MPAPGESGNVVAAVCSFFIPGLGQLVQGRLLPAAVLFVLGAGGYAMSFLILPLIVAVPVHLWSIYDAAVWRGEP
jgi:hypothetical protein